MAKQKIHITIDSNLIEKIRRDYAGNVSVGIAIILTQHYATLEDEQCKTPKKNAKKKTE